MPSLYNFVDRVSDVVISAFSTSTKHSTPSSPTHSRSNRSRRQSYDYDDYHYYQEDPAYKAKYNTRSSSKRRRTRQPGTSNPSSFAVEGARSSDSDSSCAAYDNDRSWKRSWHDKSVHWGGTTELAENIRGPKAPGLREYPERRNGLRNRDRKYVYGKEEFLRQSLFNASKGRSRHGTGPGAFPYSEGSTGSSYPGSELGTETQGSESTYEDQRYPEDWYSPSSQMRQPLHRTHRPLRSILRRPTATDDEMLIRNLWAMVVLADERLDYTYEFLAGSLLVGDDVVDTMMATGEMMMSEEATERAKRVNERRREKAMKEDSYPVRIPVPPSRRQMEREARRENERMRETGGMLSPVSEDGDESDMERPAEYESARPSSRMEHYDDDSDEPPSPERLHDILEEEEE